MKLLLYVIWYLVLSSIIAAENLSGSSMEREEEQIESRLIAAETSQLSTRRLATPTKQPTKQPTAPRHCNCLYCTEQGWNKYADGITCGARMTWLTNNDATKYPTETHACARVAGIEFRSICGPACDPARCTRVSMASRDLYCFPTYANRKQYTNVWNKYDVQVKESANLCGPHNNYWSRNTVSVTSTNKLVLNYMAINGKWLSSEVRVLPPAGKPFTYGTYKFSIGSVSVIDLTTSTIVSKALPRNIALGLFTWDDTELNGRNANHEVDIEISQWSNPSVPDVQFLAQPYQHTPRYRFYSGTQASTLNPGNNIYSFTWNPGQIDWNTTAGGGKTYKYSTKSNIINGVTDYVQCLPANMELRLNLWNNNGINGPIPSGFNEKYKVQVTITDFTFTPSGLTSVPNGGYCSKDCMCNTSSKCLNSKCVART